MVVEPTGVTPSGPNATAAVTGAISKAARATGTDFQYLVATAQVESKLNPNAAVGTSSARGLFQFIDQTWLATLKEQGPALGYGGFANAIARTASGQYVVTDPSLGDRIMNLRFDPTANAMMAGAYTKANAIKLENRLGRPATGGELYVAHFLGANGASRLIDLAESRPGVNASEVFPGAAQANRSVFFSANGQPRTAIDVYRNLVGRFDVARGPVAAKAPVMATAWPVNSSADQRTAFAPDTAGLAETYAAAARTSVPDAQLRDNTPVFHGLFRTGAGREAVAPAVSSLWSVPAAPSQNPAPMDDESAMTAQRGEPSATAKPTPLDEEGHGGLGLFQSSSTNARALFRGRV